MSDVPASAQLELHRSSDEEGVVVTLQGELDLSSLPALETLLAELGSADFRRLLIDLRELQFMDSSGLALMIRIQRAIIDQGRRLELRPGPHQVQRLFALTGLLDSFAFIGT